MHLDLVLRAFDLCFDFDIPFGLALNLRSKKDFAFFVCFGRPRRSVPLLVLLTKMRWPRSKVGGAKPNPHPLIVHFGTPPSSVLILPQPPREPK